MNSESAYQEMSLIRQLMRESQRAICDDGKHYLAWGVLITAALLLTYGALEGAIPVRVRWVWVVAIALGWAFSLWAGWREGSRARVRNLASEMLGAIWIGAGIAMTLLGFLGAATGAIRLASLGGVMATVLGAAYFASAFLYRSRWVGLLAVGWWLGGVAMFLWPGRHTLPMMAGMLIALQIVPGMFLYARARAALEQPAS